MKVLLLSLFLVGCVQKLQRVDHRMIRDGYIVHPRHAPVSCTDPGAERFFVISIEDLEKYLELTSKMPSNQ